MKYNLELINEAYYITSDAEGRGKKIGSRPNEDQGAYAVRAQQEFDEFIKTKKEEKKQKSGDGGGSIVKSVTV